MIDRTATLTNPFSVLLAAISATSSMVKRQMGCLHLMRLVATHDKTSCKNMFQTLTILLCWYVTLQGCYILSSRLGLLLLAKRQIDVL